MLCSAGGHLAAIMSSTGDPMVEPNFALLFCPVTSMHYKLTEPLTRRNWMGAAPNASLIALYSAENRVSQWTAPAFVGHAINDNIVPIASSRMFAQALRVSNVSVQLHEMPSGGHELDACTGPRWSAMLERAWSFLHRRHIV